MRNIIQNPLKPNFFFYEFACMCVCVYVCNVCMCVIVSVVVSVFFLVSCSLSSCVFLNQKLRNTRLNTTEFKDISMRFFDG